MNVNQNNITVVNKIINNLAADKKKSIVASVLIIVMIVMWFKVFCNTPKNVEAAISLTEISENQAEANSQVIFVKLPNVAGRNDILTRDFFSQDNGQLGNVEVSIIADNDDEEHIKRIVKKLKLDAIELGEKPCAFINDRLLSPGEQLTVKDGRTSYKCQIMAIMKNVVLIKCGDAEIKLKLVQEDSNEIKRNTMKIRIDDQETQSGDDEDS